MKHRIVIAGLVLLALCAPTLIHAAEEDPAPTTFVASNACTQDIDRAINRERFIYHGVLYGVRPAAEEHEGATRVAQDGRTWLKTGGNQWVSADADQQLSDSQMDETTAGDMLRDFSQESDASAETPALRRGIMETQQALTSDLIPPLLQSFRALQCRLEAVCEGVSKVTGYSASDTPETMDIAIPGCDDIPVTPIASCEPNPLMNWNDIATIRSHCAPVVKGLVQYEQAHLLFLTHEDGGHRTLRQFAGFLEPVLEKLRFPFISPLRQVADFIGEWSRVPCFLPFCAE